jgi:hypothetical protein
VPADVSSSAGAFKRLLACATSRGRGSAPR